MITAIMKRTLAFLLLFSLLTPLLTACNEDASSDPLETTDTPEPTGAEETSGEEATDETTSNEEETTGAPADELGGKTLDIYLIAGQSNATGYTSITSIKKAYEWAPELEEGFSHVLYAGNSRGNGTEPRDRIFEWRKTTMRLGAASYYFGPEAGMAKALSAYYNEETGKYAGIVKYAFGGSSLLNDTTGSTSKDGNWVSPSYQNTLPSGEVVDGVTGQMYRNFLAQVETSVMDALEKDGIMVKYGFDSIRICGLYWMQGCANKAKPAEYEIAFKHFANDVRADLSEMMKRLTNSNNDCGASMMPIVVGTISQTQNLTSASIETMNKNFIAMQKSFSSKIANCYVVDNSAYPITKWENGTQVIVGSDQYHWNQADMLEIGKNVGDAMLYCAGITETDPSA